MEVLNDGDESTEYATGHIIAGDLDERFRMPLSHWSTDEYETQWNEGISRILGGGHASSCLVTSALPYEGGQPILMWTMYRVDGRVYIQQNLSMLGEVGRAIDWNRLYDGIPDIRFTNDEGRLISTWETTVDEVRAFQES
ncbi:MAG: hypothetical protein IT303_01705 [Dehalococcoidia bacterium]|nr:hypothetical protein [Dehalococcoidia bacterium]